MMDTLFPAGADLGEYYPRHRGPAVQIRVNGTICLVSRNHTWPRSTSQTVGRIDERRNRSKGPCAFEYVMTHPTYFLRFGILPDLALNQLDVEWPSSGQKSLSALPTVIEWMENGWWMIWVGGVQDLCFSMQVKRYIS
jgi:hypothetical protein